MTLSPFEVERQEFGHSLWGYKSKEVDSFLDEVRNGLAGLWQERSDLREENERLGERVARFTAMEEQLKNTLILAQDSAEKACEQAKRESELVMREAGQKAREIVHEAHEERQRLELALREMQSAEQETRQRFKALAQTVLSHLGGSDFSASDQASTLRAVVQGTPPAKQQERSRSERQGPAIDTPPTFDTASFAPPRPPDRTKAPEGTKPGRTPVTST